MEEVWKDIKGYEGIYQVSDRGRVKSLARVVERNGNKMNVRERILKPTLAKNGYYVVNLNNQGGNLCYVHRLVAEAFCDNPNNENCIDHINCIATDNRAENLRWCSYRENNNNPTTRERMSEGSKGTKISPYTIKRLREVNSRAVLQIKDGQVIKRWVSLTEAAKAIGVTEQSLSKCCTLHERHRKIKGFEWKRERDEKGKH